MNELKPAENEEWYCHCCGKGVNESVEGVIGPNDGTFCDDDCVDKWLENFDNDE